jgi:hypothetical protein
MREIKHIREGKHGPLARPSRPSRSACPKGEWRGVDCRRPKEGHGFEADAPKRRQRLPRGHKPARQDVFTETRSRATRQALPHEGHAAASAKALA